MTPGDELLFLALGGSGEIGMNANLYGCQGKWILVDLGISFSDPSYPGIELYMPDLEFIEQRRRDLLAIVLTHGHEDHIGAIPYLAERLGAPMYATPFTAGLIAHKLKNQGLTGRLKLNVVPENGTIDLGPFHCRYIPLAHSIAEGNALLIDTPHGRIFHTGDWKLDDDPLVGTPSTPAELTTIGDTGVLALVCDSTNVFNPEASGSEAMVRTELMEEVSRIETRVVVTTFASNAARLDTLGRVATATKRKLCIAGRSLDRMLEIGKAAGYFSDFPDIVDFDTAMRLPRDEVMIVATGGQGEARAALARIAEGGHRISLDAGDVVLFSSKQIPGNELAIGRIQNLLAAEGVAIVTERQADIHVSGHPGRPELAEMYRWIRPALVLPVHGEIRHMHEQARFAAQCGVPDTLVQQNGDLVRLAPGKPQILSRERNGRLVLDGTVLLSADGMTMNERRKISQHGQMSVAIALDDDDELFGEPVIRMQGVPLEKDREAFLDEAGAAVAAAVEAWSGDLDDLHEAVRLAARRCATRWTGKKPVVDVLLIEK